MLTERPLRLQFIRGRAEGSHQRKMGVSRGKVGKRFSIDEHADVVLGHDYDRSKFDRRHSQDDHPHAAEYEKGHGDSPLKKKTLEKQKQEQEQQEG